MADKKYYWLKLKKDFFKRHDIKIIESMENGKDYVLFYLKLLCESVDHDGSLRFSETIPYDEKMLATITGTNIDIVRSAMKVFTSLQMVEILDDQTIFMNEVEKMIGGESESAERVRKHRALKAKQLQCNAIVTNCNIEKDIEEELDLEEESDDKKESKKEIKKIVTLDFSKMTDEELVDWGNKPPDTSMGGWMEQFTAWNDEMQRRSDSTEKSVGKNVECDGKKKHIKSHADIMKEWGCSKGLQSALTDFLIHCYANGHLIINSTLEDIIYRLDTYYNKDEDDKKIASVRLAISSGCYDIKELRGVKVI